ncbi:MAG: SPOR domain-containing protein [Paracoccaceae bacterium]
MLSGYDRREKVGRIIARGASVSAVALLTGCLATTPGSVSGTSAVGDVGAQATQAASARSVQPGPNAQIDPRLRPAPEEFEAAGIAEWDGARTLQGIWVAHPAAQSARRVRILNTATGFAVDGALFRRDANDRGPAVLVSSDAASALGMEPNEEVRLEIVAITRQPRPVSEEPTVAAAEPAGSETASAEEVAPEPTAGQDEGASLAASETEMEVARAEAAEPADPLARLSTGPAAPQAEAETDDAGETTASTAPQIPGGFPFVPDPQPEVAPEPTPEPEPEPEPAAETPEPTETAAAPSDGETFRFQPAPSPIPPTGSRPEPVAPRAPEVDAADIAVSEPEAPEPEAPDLAVDDAVVPDLEASEPDLPEPEVRDIVDAATEADPEGASEEEGPVSEPATDDAPSEIAAAPAPDAPAGEVAPAAPALETAEPAEARDPEAESFELAAVEPTDPAPEEPTEAVASELNLPFIQAGIFGVQANAERLIRTIREAGLPAEGRPLTLNGRTLTRVVSGPYATSSERQAALRTIRRIGPNDALPVRN